MIKIVKAENELDFQRGNGGFLYLIKDKQLRPIIHSSCIVWSKCDLDETVSVGGFTSCLAWAQDFRARRADATIVEHHPTGRQDSG